MFARRYMHEYGATGEDLGRVSVSARGYAATNPAAHFFGRPLTRVEPEPGIPFPGLTAGGPR